MKVLSIGLALALPAIAGCGQTANQSSLPSGAASAVRSVVSLGRVHPDLCNFKSYGTSSGGGTIKWKVCNSIIGRMTYGPGSAGNLKIGTQAYASNPGSVPVPAGETPVLFIQMQVLPQDPGPATFTAPTVPPGTNKAKINGLPAGSTTYKFYAYNGSTLQAGFPVNLGAAVGGTLTFSGATYSPLPLLPTLPVGTVISFELTKP